MDVHKEKKLYREDLLSVRLRLPFEDVMEKSLEIQKRFLSLPEYKKARKIALYASFKNEVLTETIFDHAVANKKDVFFPRVSRRKDSLVFKKVRNKDELSTGSYRILEPKESEEDRPISCFDLVVVPGIVFDITGNRIGYGKGYYDMTLKDYNNSGTLIGLAYNMQVLKEIPYSSHDVKVDMIITEDRVIDTRLVMEG